MAESKQAPKPPRDAAAPAPSAQAGEEAHDVKHIEGVFSTMGTQTIGTGTTRKKTTQEFFYFAQENEEGKVDLKPLNDNNLPTGNAKAISKEELLEKYTPQPEVYVKKVLPAMRELQKTVARADRLRKQGQPFTAEVEYKSALKLDENCCRAVFGLGLTYMERGETDKAEGVFKKLVELDEAFHSENKHLFNEFGMGLRKNKMVEESIHYYVKAFKSSKQNDENLLYNMARAFFDKGDMKMAGGALQKALKLNPQFAEARKFLLAVKKRMQQDPAAQPAPGAAPQGEPES